MYLSTLSEYTYLCPRYVIKNMLGAIIGDLAAWTWERDQSLFYQRLIAPKANISEVGLAVLGLTEPMLRGSIRG